MAKPKQKPMIDNNPCDVVETGMLEYINNSQNTNLSALIAIRGRMEDKWVQLSGYSPLSLSASPDDDADSSTLGKLRQAEEAMSDVIADIAQVLVKFESL